MKDPVLWQRLQEFPFDESGVALPFSSRLARENGWSHSFARQVVEEYRRFLYLGMCAGHPVTPSDEVDQAWHLHMVYTRSYWDDLCGGVLGKSFHHGPTRGGDQEAAKYRQWYGETLSTYAAEFGVTPPSDIWPQVDERFSTSRNFRRVDTGANLVVPKKVLHRAGWAALSGATAITLAGCVGEHKNGLIVFGGIVFLGLIAIIIIIRTGWGGGNGGGGGCGSCGSGCGSGCGGCGGD
ncbi:MAG: hypothetical protein R3F19_03350 [Verrucomicrobiales bacterium]